MNTLLTISSQGQVLIPIRARKILGVVPGDRLKLRVVQNDALSSLVLELPTKSWTKRIAGVAEGQYGKGEEYVSSERDAWSRS
ncbi:AbrB/MazE/SpoVT family DNA-binding domain-containing protein [Candidatus Gottesmanbacteria bacterium]|nr:AbrB/MazE/SpoVT family DNA-binding domain-containing protein [Candidatus Gottesmanbacteria bacterium]